MWELPGPGGLLVIGPGVYVAVKLRYDRRMADSGTLAGRLRPALTSGPTVALALAFAAAALMVIVPIAYWLVDPVPLPEPFPAQHQTAESLLYFAGYGVLLPFAVWAALVWRERISTVASGEAFSGMVAILVAGLAVAALLARLLAEWPVGEAMAATLALGLAWLLVALPPLILAARPGPPAWLDRLAGRSGRVWTVAGIAAVAATAMFVDWSEVSRGALAVGLLAAAGALFAYGRVRLPDPGSWGLAIDLAALGLILLAIPDLVVLDTEAARTDPAAAFDTSTIQFHQNLFLGAAAQVNSGSALLVDTVSQYGIGSIYLIAAFFQIAPIGHGTLGFFDAVLSAGMFAGGYAVVRMAGVGRLLAFSALAVAIVALVYGLQYPIGGLLQHGAIRFGLPMLLVVAAVAAVRWPASARVMSVTGLVVVGLASVWALEAFFYVVVTYSGLVVMGAVWRPDGARVRWALRQAVLAIAAIAATQVLFALATVAASGSLPDWGLYLTYLRDFLAGDIGDLTYDFAPWSPAIAVATLYAASAAGIAVLARLARPLVDQRRAAFIALAGSTAYGVALFSYIDNRSLEHILPYVCLPAVIVGVIWLALALDRGVGLGIGLRRWALGLSLLVSVVAVANVWPAAGTRFSDSVLAAVPPGGNSLRAGLDRLWNMPPILPGAAEGERLVERYMPGETETAVLVEADLDTNILTRAGRANSLGITDAKEMSWVPDPHLPRLRDREQQLVAGDRVLMDDAAIEAFRRFRRQPGQDPAQVAVEADLKTIQAQILAWMAERFDYRVIARGSDDLVVVELTEPSTAGRQ